MDGKGRKGEREGEGREERREEGNESDKKIARKRVVMMTLQGG